MILILVLSLLSGLSMIALHSLGDASRMNIETLKGLERNANLQYYRHTSAQIWMDSFLCKETNILANAVFPGITVNNNYPAPSGTVLPTQSPIRTLDEIYIDFPNLTYTAFGIGTIWNDNRPNEMAIVQAGLYQFGAAYRHDSSQNWRVSTKIMGPARLTRTNAIVNLPVGWGGNEPLDYIVLEYPAGIAKADIPSTPALTCYSNGYRRSHCLNMGGVYEDVDLPSRCSF